MTNMKLVSLLALSLLSSYSAAQKSSVNIPSGEVVQIRFSAEESTEVIHNPSNTIVNVQVKRVVDREFVRGFVLSQNSKEKVWVESDAILILRNDSDKTIEVRYESSAESSMADSKSNGEFGFICDKGCKDIKGS